MTADTSFERNPMRCINAKLAASILACSAAFLALPGALAQKSVAEPVNERTQLEFCATYLPCGIAVGLMDGVVAGEAQAQKLKNFFSNLGRKPAMSRSEFEAFAESQGPIWRNEQVSKCIVYKGVTYQDFCEEMYLTGQEQKQAREAREPSRTALSAESARLARADILDRDAKHYNGLWVNCKGDRADSADCGQSILTFAQIKTAADALNADPDFSKFFPLISLRSEALARQTHDYDGRNWMRKRDGAQAFQKKFDDCEYLRRELYTLIDGRNFAEAKGMAERLRNECGKIHGDFDRTAIGAMERIVREAPPASLAALPKRSETDELGAAGSKFFAATLQRAHRGDALDDKTLPGRGGVAASGGDTSSGGAEVLAGVFMGIAQNLPGMTANPMMSGLLHAMQARERAELAAPPLGSSRSASNTSAQQLAGGSPIGSVVSGSCTERAQLVETIEADFTRRLNSVPASNQVGRLGLLHSVTTTVGEIWLPCNPAKAKSYRDAADSTLKTCTAIATAPGVCTPDIVWSADAGEIGSPPQQLRERQVDQAGKQREITETLKQISGAIAEHQRDKAERASPRPVTAPGKRACSPTCGVQ